MRLTGRILKQNGWVHDESYEWVMLGKNVPTLQEYEDRTFKYNISGYVKSIKTIEDLFDLFNFIGRNDLIRDFKVSKK